MRVYIVASGESLKEFDFSKLQSFDVIAVNNSFKSVPFCKYIAAVDTKFYKENYNELQQFSGQMHSVLDYDSNALKIEMNVNLWKSDKSAGISQNPYVSHNFNSGLFAINLAVNLGYTDIRLLGFDCGGKHYYDNVSYDYSHMVAKARLIKNQLPQNVTVTNYSIKSKCGAFKRKNIKYFDL